MWRKIRWTKSFSFHIKITFLFPRCRIYSTSIRIILRWNNTSKLMLYSMHNYNFIWDNPINNIKIKIKKNINKHSTNILLWILHKCISIVDSFLFTLILVDAQTSFYLYNLLKLAAAKEKKNVQLFIAFLSSTCRIELRSCILIACRQIHRPQHYIHIYCQLTSATKWKN